MSRAPESINIARIDNTPIFPPENLDKLLDLTLFLDGLTEPALLLGPDGEKVPLPEEIYLVLRRVVDDMREGKATMVAPLSLLLTTQEAADFLNLSRPTVVKLMESGEIPFEKPSRHRRVKLEDLVSFQQRRRVERRTSLNELTVDAGKLGIYEETLDHAQSAVKAARKRRADARAKQ